ncbi:MAG: PKD domain-containing protein [Bacteroidota bacterium]
MHLVGSKSISSGQAPETHFEWYADSAARQTNPLFELPITTTGTEAYIETDGVPSDTYWVRYVYKNSFGVTSEGLAKVIVAASPIAVIDVNNSCVKDLIQFNDASTLPNNQYPSSITSWHWDFDDQSFAIVQSPTHAYIVPGYKNITLTATSTTTIDPTHERQCAASTTRQIRVGDVPTIDYSFSAFCNNDKTNFKDHSDSGVSTITSYTWDFGDGVTVTGAKGVTIPGAGNTTGTFDNPDHHYAAAGSYTSKLTITTDDGCVNSLPQSINIFDYVTVQPLATQAYFETFDKGNRKSWLPESLSKRERADTDPNDSIRYSWIRMIPNGVNITPLASATDTAWWTGRRCIAIILRRTH